MSKKKKVTLPFVVAPRREPITEILGTEESGQIEIHRKGYLTVAEKTFIQQATNGDSSVGLVHKLAAKVGKKRHIEASEALQVLSQGDFSDPILEGFEEEVSEIYALMGSYEERRQIIASTCLLFFRVSQEWTIEDTMDLHPDLVADLYELFLDEDRKAVEAFEKTEAIEEEEENTEGK
jgi:hypothetical protein